MRAGFRPGRLRGFGPAVGFLGFGLGVDADDDGATSPARRAEYERPGFHPNGRPRLFCLSVAVCACGFGAGAGNGWVVVAGAAVAEGAGSGAGADVGPGVDAADAFLGGLPLRFGLGRRSDLTMSTSLSLSAVDSSRSSEGAM